MVAMSDVCKEFVSEPKAGDLLGDLRALALDEGDPVAAVADAEFFDFSER